MKTMSTVDILKSLIAVIVLLLCSWGITHAQAADPPAKAIAGQDAAPTPEAVHGSWQMLCSEPETCRIAQSIILKDSQRPVVVARFYRSKPAPAAAAAETPVERAKTKGKKKSVDKPSVDDTAVAVGVFTMPLGIFLAPGFALKVDDKAVRRFAYENCDVEGCHLGIKVDAALMGELSSGKVATVQFYDAAQKPVVLNLSLDGFAPAFEALK